MGSVMVPVITLAPAATRQQRVWSERRTDGAARLEYHVATLRDGRRVLVTWTPSTTRTRSERDAAVALAQYERGEILAEWPAAERDGGWYLDALVADRSPDAAAVLAAWPARWREVPGYTVPAIFPGAGTVVPPSGARVIGEVLA